METRGLDNLVIGIDTVVWLLYLPDSGIFSLQLRLFGDKRHAGFVDNSFLDKFIP